MVSATAVSAEVTTGIPQAIASSAIIPNDSARDGIRKTSAALSASASCVSSFSQPVSMILNLSPRPTKTPRSSNTTR